MAHGWNKALDRALDEMNRALKDRVELTFSVAEKPINAHIVIDTMQSDELHGKARTQYAKDGGKTWIDSVTVLIPAAPRIYPNDPKSRAAGDGVRLYLLVHELIHSIGPTVHTPGDVFSAKVSLIPGKTAADDTVQFDAQHKSMPPIFFDGATIKKIQEAWPTIK
jgi:hypothetical protein